MRLFFTITIGLGLLSIMLLTSCGKRDAGKSGVPKETSTREVRVGRAETRPMERVLHVVGTLAAREEAVAAAQVSGQLEKNLADLGDQVKAGQEIALIDTASYEALAGASAANLARATASAANATQNLKRIQDLQQNQIASTSDLDAAVAEAGRTRAEVKAAEANDAVARLNLERSHVKAPFDGVIAERLASAGDYLAVGTPIARLVQTDPLRLRLDVPERESIAVRVGQSVRVSVEGDTNIYRGQIQRIAPAIRADNRMLPVEADVPNPGGLRAGLFARAAVVVNEQEAVVSIPADALVTFAGLEKVVLIKDGKAAEKNVTTGRREKGWVEIVAGLNAGETVVLTPAGIRTGQSLKPDSAGGTSITAHTNAAK
jgi:RND family efflux transporter MFP subunit